MSPSRSASGGAPLVFEAAHPLSSSATPSAPNHEHLDSRRMPLLRRPVLLLLGGFIVTMLAALTAATAATLMLWHSDRLLPGVQVFDIGLGGHTTAEAEALLSSYWRKQTIQLEAGEQSWTVIPETLGIAFDSSATVQLAYGSGRSPAHLAALLRTRRPIPVPPVWVFDEGVASAQLLALAPQLRTAPTDAGIQIVDGRVEATPAVPGSELDLSASLAKLAENPSRAIVTGRLPLVTVQLEPAITDVSEVVAQANELLSTVISLQLYEPLTGQVVTRSIPPATWSDWLSLEISGVEKGQFEWSVDKDRASLYLTDQVRSLGTETYLDWDSAMSELVNAIANHGAPATLRVLHNPTQHVVQPGETLASIGRDHGIPYPWIEESNPGLGERLSIGQVVLIPSVDRLLPLPVITEKRILVSISRQRMWAYQDGRLTWEWPVSTGIDSSPTAPGIFQIQSHEREAYAGNWDLWMPYFMGIYRPVPSSGFMNGFHGFPSRNGTDLLWTGNLGRQATYGCILISTVNAAALFDWAEEGVVVEIQR